MKKLILLSTLLFSGISLQAGEVFPTSDAIWNFNKIYNRNFLYGLTGDTLINDTLYHKLYLLSDTTLNKNSLKKYLGGIREQDRKIYLRTKVEKYIFLEGNKTQEKEVLLYDFSKDIGDTIVSPMYYNNTEEIDFINESDDTIDAQINSITVDDKNRKHYIITSTSTGRQIEEWIEGIGTTSNLFFFSAPFTTGEMISSDTELQCFKHQGIIEYSHNPKGNRCETCFCQYQFVVNIKEEVSGNIKLYFLANTGELQLIIPQIALPVQLELYDLSGKLICKNTIKENLSHISIIDLQSSTYIYRISNLGKALQSGKIIIN